MAPSPGCCLAVSRSVCCTSRTARCWSFLRPSLGITASPIRLSPPTAANLELTASGTGGQVGAATMSGFTKWSMSSVWKYVCPLSEEHRRQIARFCKVPFDNEKDLMQRELAWCRVLNHRMMQARDEGL